MSRIRMSGSQAANDLRRLALPGEQSCRRRERSVSAVEQRRGPESAPLGYWGEKKVPRSFFWNCSNALLRIDP